MEVLPRLMLFTVLPITLMFAAERFSLFWLSRTQERKDWVRSQMWLHPNFISRCRYPMGVVSLLLFHFEFHHTAILWFSFWMITDITDGTIARVFHMGTPEGEVIDPLSDKLLYLPPLFYMAYQGVFPVYMVWIFLAFDVFGQFSRYFIENKAANLFGKAKTFLVVATLVAATLFLVYVGEAPLKVMSLLLGGSTLLAFCSMFFKVVPNYWYANVLSILNFLCGICGIVLILLGYPAVFAFALVFFGQFLDLFDGRAAERWGSTPKGELLDDLADGTNFGGTIALIAYSSFLNELLGIVMGIVYFVSTAYRLIRFLSDKKKAGVEGGVSVFSGLPSPAGALFVGSSVIFIADMVPVDYWFHPDWMKLSIVIIGSLLMISKIPYIHFGRVLLPAIPKMIKVLLLTFILVAVLISWHFRDEVIVLGVVSGVSILYLLFGHRIGKTAAA